MGHWKKIVRIKHLLSEKKDYNSIKESMSKIADVLENESLFKQFDTKKFRDIPEGDEVISPVDYANKLLDRMYDYSDENKIWIE